jgi:amino acid adenylation domain-containing protein
MNNRVETSYPLSPTQQGMLAHSLHDGDGTYILQSICVMGESVDLALLATAWRQVIQRHAVLRTSFSWEGQGPPLQRPIQEVHGEPKVPFISDDWSSLAAEIQQERMDNFLESDSQRGFSLDALSLMRVTVFKLGDCDYRMVWTLHHALLDGRSHFLLLRELFDRYDALCEGRELHLEEPRPYHEYIKWLAEQELSKAELFWRDSLSGFTAPTSLRVAAPRNADQHMGQRHATSEIRLSEKLTAQLRLCAKQNGVTLNTLVQASWALLLSRYSGEEDVLFGVTRAGRHWTASGAESMVGLFLNTLPFRVKIRREQQLTAWLKELRAQHLAHRDYEHTPLVKIKEWSAVPSGVSLFDSVLVFENAQWSNFSRELGRNWSRRGVEWLDRSSYPLTLSAYADRDLLLKLEYHQQQLDRETIDRMLEQLKTVQEGIAENPDRRLGELPLLTEVERRQLLIEWNQPTRRASHKSIPQLFEQQANRTPDAVAVVLENESLTYRELNKRANQLAHYLRRRGVGPDELVALCFERSLEMIVSVLGTLKAGAAYVPMDPAYPAERLSFMLADAGARVLLTDVCMREKLPPHNLEVINVDSDWETITSENPSDNIANPDSTLTPENLAYVIYTSGSTGQPKGVLVTHSNVVRLFERANASFQFNQNDVWTLFHSYAFDFSVWELWGALLYGGRLVLVPYWVTRSPENFYRLLREERITVLNQTPSAFRQLSQAEKVLGEKDEPAAQLALRLIIFGGEALETNDLRSWWERHGDQLPQLVNMYGITETTVHATYRLLKVADLAGRTSSLIGRPLGDLQIYILDQYQELVPTGVPGELCVSGAGLSRGYLNRPDLTAERFIPHPFSAEAGARLYRTGDVGRHLANGEIEYLGRHDRQVKIRGFRIELGEIESVLAQHEDISECIVIARDGTPGDRQLTAYIILGRGRALNLESVRPFLRQRLPSHMVPAFFTSLEEFPLTPNGKIDRRALPLPETSHSDSGEAFVAPRSETEKRVAAIWGDVLRREEIGIYDNFFDLGGNSLLATQVMSRVRDVFQQEFPVRRLFEYPRLEEFGGLIDKSGHAESSVHSPAMVPLTREADMFEVRGGSNSRGANSTGRK